MYAREPATRPTWESGSMSLAETLKAMLRTAPSVPTRDSVIVDVRCMVSNLSLSVSGEWELLLSCTPPTMALPSSPQTSSLLQQRDCFRFVTISHSLVLVRPIVTKLTPSRLGGWMERGVGNPGEADSPARR